MRFTALVCLSIMLFIWGCQNQDAEETGGHGAPLGAGASQASGLEPEESRHLKNLRRITADGADAEAYFSPDGSRLVFQSTREGHAHDQIYTVGVEGGSPKRVSPGPGKTTCAFFMPDGGRLVYATTHRRPDAELLRYDMSKGEAWSLDPAFDIVSCRADGSDIRWLTDTDGYDAECAVSRTTGRIVFCSTRTGDPEIFVMNADGTGVRQLTFEKGYDGGPFFSVDGKKIIWRTYRPAQGEREKTYDALISRHKVGRWPFDIWIMNSDGTGKTRITRRGEEEGRTCWAPYLHPGGKIVVFVSSTASPGGGRPNFDLYTVRIDGTNMERITTASAFDAFPMFSDDGKKISFVSSRGAAKRGEVSVFVADWIP